MDASPSSTTTRRGVVTASDANLFRDLQFMIRSLRAADDTTLYVYDLGLQHDQLNWCLRQPNVVCRTVPEIDPVLSSYVGKHRWQAWLKPSYLAACGLDQVLWIDADCVVLSPLCSLFEILQEKPVLMPEVAKGCGSNHLELYTTHLPIRAPEQRGWAEINNGVVGLDLRRDRALLDAWLHAVRWAIESPELRHLMRWYDQGALLWAILSTESEHHIQTDNAWNFPANATAPLLDISSEKACGLLDAIRDAHPCANLVHYFGLVKLSIALDGELERKFLRQEVCR